MNELDLTYENTTIRTISEDDCTWWALIDVCTILELSNPSRVAERLDDDERHNFKLGRQGDAWFVNEPGLYHVILTSRSEKAKPFRRWVTHDVLPSIRKQGYYSLYSDEDTLKLIMEKVERQLTETSLIPFDQRTTILDKINKTQIKSEIKAKIKDQKYKLIQELWKSDFASADTTEFMHKLQSICNGDAKLFHKYWDLYNQQKNPKFRGVVIV